MALLQELEQLAIGETLPRRGERGVARTVTMRDVAALAGVGVATVSRVINGTPGVAPELVARVGEAVRKLGYRHDTTASSLRRADRRTDTIGLVVEDVANPFASALQRAVQDTADERGVLVLGGSNDEDPAREERLIRSLTARRVDGLVVVPTGRPVDELIAASQHGTPIVCADRPVDLAGIDTVTVDNRGGVRDAVHRLHQLGHRRIGFLCDLETIWTARERYLGFVEALAALGCPLRPHLVRRDLHDENAAQHAATELLTQTEPPTALLAAQNLITIGTRRALQQLHLETQVALIGFDDFPLADLLRPGVSVIAQDPTGLGRTAAELLFTRLDGDAGPAQHRTLPTRYIARGSGELPGP